MSKKLDKKKPDRSDVVDCGDPNTKESSLYGLARRGDPDAQYELGNQFFKGEGRPQSLAQAAIWWEVSANQGNAAAQFALGDYLRIYLGQNTLHQAIEWLQKANRQGVIKAAHSLGEAYFRLHDFAEALKWERLAACRGCLEAHEAIARIEKASLSYTTDSADINYPDLIKEAADGIPFAQLLWGQFLLQSTSQDSGRGITWIKRAAKQGCSEAQYALGVAYENERPAKAIKWWKRAADQGDAESQYSLGFVYSTWDGVTFDEELAFGYFSAAANQGYEDAKLILEAMHFVKKEYPSIDPRICFGMGFSVLGHKYEKMQGNETALTTAKKLLQAADKIGSRIAAERKAEQAELLRRKQSQVPLHELTCPEVWDAARIWSTQSPESREPEIPIEQRQEDWGDSLDDQDGEFWEDYFGGPDE